MVCFVWALCARMRRPSKRKIVIAPDVEPSDSSLRTKNRAVHLLIFVFLVMVLVVLAATVLAAGPTAVTVPPTNSLANGSAPAGYALYGTNGASRFTIDLETGESTRLGSGGFIISLAPGGHDFIYGEGRFDNASRLYRVDIATGSAEEVGLTELAQTGSGLAFGEGQLLGADQWYSGSSLSRQSYSINTASGVGSVIGPTPGQEDRLIVAMTYHSRTASYYGINEIDDTFGFIDPSTGIYSATFSLGFDQSGTGGLASHPETGVIYGVLNRDSSSTSYGLYEIDPVARTVEFIAEVTTKLGISFGPAVSPLTPQVYLPVMVG